MKCGKRKTGEEVKKKNNKNIKGNKKKRNWRRKTRWRKWEG